MRSATHIQNWLARHVAKVASLLLDQIGHISRPGLHRHSKHLQSLLSALWLEK
jgi:hypothetical protein